jgi:tRNA pseudouridine55 synthase
VARVRRVLPGAKVGHAGTLDPDATGVLVVCVGKATKISSFLMEAEKTYEGTGRLGLTTDTQDASGRVLRERPVEIGEGELREASRRFVGRIEQIPPMFSAVKVEGKKLYRLARRGVEVERAARPVTVHSFEIGRVEPPEFDFAVRCSKGTYVRTLVHDLGEALGCGGHLLRLARTRQGDFDRARCLAWESLAAPDAAERIADAAVDPEEALAFLPRLGIPAGSPPLRVGHLVPRPEGAETGLHRLVVSGDRVGGIGKVGDDGLRVLYLFPTRVGYGRGARAT